MCEDLAEYEFEVLDDQPHKKSYTFCPDTIDYVVLFDSTQSTSVTNQLNLDEVYTISIIRDSKDVSKHDAARFDKTLIAIFKEFYKHHPNAILIYHCDYRDGRQNARHRLFTCKLNKSANELGISFDKSSQNISVEFVGDVDINYGYLVKSDSEKAKEALSEFLNSFDLPAVKHD